MIFHTKYPKIVHVSLCSAQFFNCTPPNLKSWIHPWLLPYNHDHPSQCKEYIVWLRIRIMCSIRVTWLPWDCYFSELALLKSYTTCKCNCVGLVQSRHHHYHLIECSLFSPWDRWKIAHLVLNNNHLHPKHIYLLLKLCDRKI